MERSMPGELATVASFFAVGADLVAPGAGPVRRVLFDSDVVTALLLGGPPSIVSRHVHRYHDELGYLLEGSGTLTIGDEVHELAPGVTWAIARGTPHGAEFTGPFRLLSWFTPRDDPAAPDRVEVAEDADGAA